MNTPGKTTGAGVKARWCHFAFGTEDAPRELHALSAAAKLPKERAVLSFMLAGPAGDEKREQDTSPGGRQRAAYQHHTVPVRVISDCFPLSESFGRGERRERANGGKAWGRYGCAERGLVLLTGDRNSVEAARSGMLTDVSLSGGAVDARSGALIAAETNMNNDKRR